MSCAVVAAAVAAAAAATAVVGSVILPIIIPATFFGRIFFSSSSWEVRESPCLTKQEQSMVCGGRLE